MLKKLKRLCGDLIIALISLTIIASWFVLPGEAEMNVSYLKGVAPSNGAGRFFNDEIEAFKIETIIDTTETETPEICALNVPEEVIETEAIPETELIEVIPEADPIIETDIDALIVQVASEYGLPWQLVRAVCWVESGIDPNAISSTGDYGLMQVSYVNHGWLGLDNPLDPEENLRAGCTILKTALDNSGGDFTRALMRYNRGDAYAMSQWSQGIFSTAYTDKVLERYYAYLRGEY